MLAKTDGIDMKWISHYDAISITAIKGFQTGYTAAMLQFTHILCTNLIYFPKYN